MMRDGIDAASMCVGPVIRANGYAPGAFRVGEDGALILSDGHGRFSELAARNQLFTAFTSLTGLALTGAAPPAAGAATFLSVLNPLGSGVNLEILQGIVALVSATTFPAGAWCWCGAFQATRITAAEAGATKQPLFVGQAVTRVLAWAGATLTGSAVHANIRPFPLATFAAVDSEIDQRVMVDNVDGGIVVPPGCIITLAPPATGTTVTGSACIIWAEVPLPQGAAGDILS